MKKNKNGSVVVPILNDEYKVVVCWGDVKYIEKVRDDWHHEKSDTVMDVQNRRGLCYFHKNGHPIIALPRYPKTAEEIGTLAHEATHAVSNIFDKIAESGVDEVYAHSVGAVVRKVLKVSNK